MYLVSKFAPAMEQYAVWGNGFTLEDCDTIKNIGELLEFQKGRTGSSVGDTNLEIRDTDVTWIPHREDTDFIYRRMNEIASRVNYDKFQLDLTGFDHFQYSKYKVDGHYDWHTDTHPNPSDGLFRKLSLVLMLSDPEEYEGGEFLINVGGNESRCEKMKLKKGEVIAFYSSIPHKVAPVTSGERLTMVTWVKGPKIK